MRGESKRGAVRGPAKTPIGWSGGGRFVPSLFLPSCVTPFSVPALTLISALTHPPTPLTVLLRHVQALPLPYISPKGVLGGRGGVETSQGRAKWMWLDGTECNELVWRGRDWMGNGGVSWVGGWEWMGKSGG